MEVRIADDELEKFIYSLQKQTIAKVLRTVDLLGMFGNRLGMPHNKKISPRLLELRVSGDQGVRIFYTFHKNNAVLLTGFVKKTNKVPPKEISHAFRKLTRLD